MKIPPALARKCLALAGEPAPPRPATAPAGRRRLALEVTIAVRTASEANVRGKARAYMARKAAVKDAIRAAMPCLADRWPLPVRVTLTRVSGGQLDDDNLRPALKAVRDEVASWLGVDDADRRVKWRYRQRPGWTPAVVIRIEHREE